MLDYLNEQRSWGVGTFLIIEWRYEGAEGNLRNNPIETPKDSSVFIPQASSEKSAFINFLEFLFSTVLFCGKKSP